MSAIRLGRLGSRRSFSPWSLSFSVILHLPFESFHGIVVTLFRFNRFYLKIRTMRELHNSLVYYLKFYHADIVGTRKIISAIILT